MPAVAERPHRVEQLVEQGPVHPGRRLVEQDQLGIGHEHADELHQLLLAIGEIARELAGEPLELDEAQQLRARAPRACANRRGRHDQEVLERGQLGKDADDLEGPPDAEVEDLVGREAVDAPALEADRALVARARPR